MSTQSSTASSAEPPVLALNPALDARDYQEAFARDGYVQVPGVFTPATAELIAQILERRTAWNIAFSEDDGSGGLLNARTLQNLGKDAMRPVVQKVMRQAAEGKFSFLFGSYQMLTTYLDGQDQGHPLHDVLQFLNTPEYLDFVRAVTRDDLIMKADAQATLYQGGHFLTVHNDHHPHEWRRHAYTLGFTRKWEPHWGGELLFHDEQGNIERGLLPGFNLLTIFKVPRQHSVGFVAPFATAPRHSITGWLRNDPPATGA